VRSELIPFALGDVVRLKKPHPCGSYEWTVVRLGADIGLQCQTCRRRVLLPRRDVERRLKAFISRADPSQTEVDHEHTTIDGTEYGAGV
jgi:hypothetical protein